MEKNVLYFFGTFFQCGSQIVLRDGRNLIKGGVTTATPLSRPLVTPPCHTPLLHLRIERCHVDFCFLKGHLHGNCRYRLQKYCHRVAEILPSNCRNIAIDCNGWLQLINIANELQKMLHYWGIKIAFKKSVEHKVQNFPCSALCLQVFDYLLQFDSKVCVNGPFCLINMNLRLWN